MRYIDKNIPSIAATFCYTVKDIDLLVYNMNIVKKDKKVRLLYILSLFNLFIKLGYA